MKNNDMILTTAPTVEGYRIIEQCGVVYGETVFKHGVLASIGSKILNTIDSFKVWSREVSGSMLLVENARKFAYEKMIEEAKSRGANAIIAINSDGTFGDTLMYISLFGTAVKVVPESEYIAEIQKREAEAKAVKEEKERKDMERSLVLSELEAKRISGEITEEEQFFLETKDIESMLEIWKTWQKYELKEKYPDVDTVMADAKEIERMYGRSAARTEAAKKNIKNGLGINN